MTKEELEKEAGEKYHNHKMMDFQGFYNYHYYYLGYVESAEPREKRIAELEATNKKISDECHKLVDTLEKKQNENELLETQNIKLQSEVNRLAIKNVDLIGKIAFTENELNNTKAQIDKMKCCGNCENRYGQKECADCHNYSKWKFKQVEQFYEESAK